MASFKAIFPVLQELFAKNHRGGPFGAPPPSGARVKFAVKGYSWALITNIKLVFEYILPFRNYNLRRF